MMKYSYMLSLLLMACGAALHTKDVGPTLISWSHEYVMPRASEDFTYYDDHERYIEKYFSIRYEEKRIVANTLMEVNCTDSIAGRIDVSHDSIFLKRDILMTDDRLCSELHKFTFIISNPKNRRYKVISTK